MKRLVIVFVLCLSACSGKNNPSETIPNYAGNWGGTYTLTSCNQSGQMAILNVCTTSPVGTSLPHRFEFSQASRSVSGRFLLGTLAFPISTATIASDGSLAIQGINADNTTTIIANWTLHLTSSAISGTITQSWTSSGLTGTLNLNGSTSGTPHVANASGSLPVLVTPRDKADGLRVPIQ